MTADILQYNCTAIRLVYTGKVLRVTTNITDGYTTGTVILSPLASASAHQPLVPPTYHLKVPFQNEFLYASRFDPDPDPSSSCRKEKIIVSVPDLLTLLDATDGSAIASADLKYGLRVHVVAMPADGKWTTAKGLEKGGLAWFGVHGSPAFTWNGAEEATRARKRSVFEEFGEER